LALWSKAGRQPLWELASPKVNWALETWLLEFSRLCLAGLVAVSQTAIARKVHQWEHRRAERARVAQFQQLLPSVRRALAELLLWEAQQKVLHQLPLHRQPVLVLSREVFELAAKEAAGSDPGPCPSVLEK
jgi:hypothetical protein